MKKPRLIPVCWIPVVWAITIPPIGVFIRRDKMADKDLIRHEYGHWEQWEEWGTIRFYRTVLAQYLKWGIRKAPVEADATHRGDTE